MFSFYAEQIINELPETAATQTFQIKPEALCLPLLNKLITNFLNCALPLLLF